MKHLLNPSCSALASTGRQKHRLATSARSRTARIVVDKDKIPLLHEVLYHRLAKSLAAGGD